MTPGFVPGFVRWLEAVTVLTIVTSRSGDSCKPGHVYVAPDAHDHTVDGTGRLTVTPSSEMPCPSADRLLTSVASAFGSRAAGLVLTGMGEDGARGLLAIRRANGVTIAQDEETSVVYGMPRAAFEMGAASAQLPLSAIAHELLQMTMGSSCSAIASAAPTGQRGKTS